MNSVRRPTTAWGKLAFGAATGFVLILFALPLAAYMNWFDWPWLSSRESLRLGAYEGDVGILEWIAKDYGFFEKAGIEVEIKGFESGKAATDALIADSVDVATASEYVVATNAATASDLRILGSISHYTNKGVVARRDRAIAVPADLRGKRVGLTSPSGAEYSLSVFLALNRLTFDDVTIVNLPPQKLTAAIAGGEIDAAITWQPHIQAMQTALGTNAVNFSGDGFDVYLLLVTRSGKIASSENAIQRLLRALVFAEEWVHANPAEAKAYLARRFALSPAYVEAQWPHLNPAVNLPQEVLVAMDAEARWLANREGRSESAIPNFAEFVHGDALKAVKPSAVTILSRVGVPRSNWKAAVAATK